MNLDDILKLKEQLKIEGPLAILGINKEQSEQAILDAFSKFTSESDLDSALQQLNLLNDAEKEQLEEAIKEIQTTLKEAVKDLLKQVEGLNQNTSETVTPETATQETATPDAATPEAATPEAATAEAATPEAATAEAATPEAATPEAATPEAATPEAATPEAATPEAATAEAATAEAATPDAATPEAATADAATPEAATAEAATPEAATPEAATPEAATPEAATPEAATPEAAAPEAATPEAAAPEAETPEAATVAPEVLRPKVEPKNEVSEDFDEIKEKLDAVKSNIQDAGIDDEGIIQKCADAYTEYYRLRNEAENSPSPSPEAKTDLEELEKGTKSLMHETQTIKMDGQLGQLEEFREVLEAFNDPKLLEKFDKGIEDFKQFTEKFEKFSQGMDTFQQASNGDNKFEGLMQDTHQGIEKAEKGKQAQLGQPDKAAAQDIQAEAPNFSM